MLMLMLVMVDFTRRNSRDAKSKRYGICAISPQDCANFWAVQTGTETVRQTVNNVYYIMGIANLFLGHQGTDIVLIGNGNGDSCNGNAIAMVRIWHSGAPWLPPALFGPGSSSHRALPQVSLRFVYFSSWILTKFIFSSCFCSDQYNSGFYCQGSSREARVTGNSMTEISTVCLKY